MLKYLFFILNSVVIIIYNLFVGDGVSLSAKIPSSATPGKEFFIEVTIKKTNVSGFAKLQIDLPAGLTASEVESKGAAYTFENHHVKYIWTGLPNEEEITIKFAVQSHPAIVGTGQIIGKFSYIQNNTKELVEFGPIDIVFSSEQIADTNTKPDSGATTTFVRPNEPNADVSCIRKVTSVRPGEEYDVELTLKKGSIKGFAKLQDEIPLGFMVTGLETDGSTFSFSEHRAKFVWPSIISKEEIKVSYKMINIGKQTQPLDLKGEFSYIENETTKRIEVPVTTVNPDGTVSQATPEPIAATKDTTTTVTATPVNTTTFTPETKIDSSITSVPTTSTTPVTTNTETPVTTNTVTETPTNTVAVVENKNTDPPEVKNVKPPIETTTKNNNVIPPPQNGKVNYMVQIGAFRRSISSDALSVKFGISEQINTQMHEGYNKFLVGNFSEYKQARDHRENVKGKGVSDAFVTAYNSGKRITVQEALMITNQKWFK